MLLILLAIVIAVAYVYFFLISDSEKYWAKLNVKYCKKSRNSWEEFVAQLPWKKTVVSDYIKELYNAHPEEPWYGVKWFSKDVLLIRDPELINTIAIKHFAHFGDHTENFVNKDLDPFLARNLFALTGDRWRDVRSIVSPTFTGSKMRGIFQLVDKCSKQTMANLIETYNNRSDKTKPLELELKEKTSKFANDVIASVAFGIECDSLANPKNEFYTMAQNFMAIKVWRMYAMQCLPFLAKIFNITLFPTDVVDYFRNMVRETLKAREANNIVRRDMLDLLVQAQKGTLKSENDDEQKINSTNSGKTVLDDEDVIAQSVVFFMAGLEGVSTLVCFISYELALSPEIQRKLLNEINESLEANNGEFTYDSVTKMKYLDMVVSETTRKWPAAIFLDRKCTSPFTLTSGDKQVHIPKDTAIMFPVLGFHNDAKYYPEPRKFDPERFGEDKDKLVPGTFLPFGIGPRNCIGMRFAIMETKIFLCHLLKTFEIVVTPKTPIPLLLLPNSVNIGARDGYWLGLKPHVK